MGARLTIYDVTGKVVKTIEGVYQKGYNEIDLRQSQLNVSGLMYYQLDTDNFTATKKMIIIK